jgi:HAD superfamily hydrolase (TIGR01549 family)
MVKCKCLHIKHSAFDAKLNENKIFLLNKTIRHIELRGRKLSLNIFFDYGGTLMDISSDGIAHYYLMEMIKSKFGLKKDVNILTKKYNESVAKSYAVADCVYRNGLENSMQTLSNLLSNENVKLDKDFSDWFRKNYIEVHAKHIRLFPEVVDVLKELRKREIPLGLISDVDNDFIYSQLEVHNLKDFFTTVVTSEEVGVCKPHKKIFEIALSRANANAKESIM